MTDRKTLTRQAHAKINLALAVGPARASDGMHPIASWMAPIDLCDTVAMQRLPDGDGSRFEIAWAPEALRPTPIDWPIEADLAVRAVRAMETETGRALPVAMRVVKRIPVGAGLGGGSSDAAAALLGVRALFNLEIDDARLGEIALGLGSDAPFFLGDGPALVTGFGHEIERTPAVVGADAVALLIPSFSCATGAVYGAVDSLGQQDFRCDLVAQLACEGVVRDADLFNDLAQGAERVEPALIEIRARIASAAGVRVHITGSGSAMFAVCQSASEADRVVESARRFAAPIAGAVVKFKR